MNFQAILLYLGIIADLAQSFPAIKGEAGIAAQLIAIAQKANAAHQAITGQPIDLSQIHTFEVKP